MSQSASRSICSISLICFFLFMCTIPIIFNVSIY
nr:MAG TPA: hypothetical protein [Caudoviricetes sp.]DAV68957.1 MAG TPA: hypothetical protein [Caudoviricetes sp.]